MGAYIKCVVIGKDTAPEKSGLFIPFRLHHHIDDHIEAVFHQQIPVVNRIIGDLPGGFFHIHFVLIHFHGGKGHGVSAEVQDRYVVFQFRFGRNFRLHGCVCGRCVLFLCFRISAGCQRQEHRQEKKGCWYSFHKDISLYWVGGIVILSWVYKQYIKLFGKLQ